MTNEEAIEILQEEHNWVQEPCYVINAIEKAIAALRPSTAISWNASASPQRRTDMDYKDLIPTIRGHYFNLTVQDSLSEEQLGKLRKDLCDMETCITDLLARAEEAEAANSQLDGTVTTLMESNKKLADALREAEARAETAEADRDRLREAMKPNCLMCDSMHENGNCTEVGGFCTAVPAAHCPMIPKLRARAEEAEKERDEARQDCAIAERNHMIEVERREAAEARAEKAERERRTHEI